MRFPVERAAVKVCQREGRRKRYEYAVKGGPADAGGSLRSLNFFCGHPHG